jgi:hypothetical protein
LQGAYQPPAGTAAAHRQKPCHAVLRDPLSRITEKERKHPIEGPIRKDTELVRLSAALYRELALSALKLLPIRRVKALL